MFAACSNTATETPNVTGGTTSSKGGSGGTSSAKGGAGSGDSSGSGGMAAPGGAGGSGGASVGAGNGGAAGDPSAGSGGSGGQTPTGAAPGAGGTTTEPSDAATGTPGDAASTPPADAPPAVMRPDAMGQPCKSAGNEAFTVSAFDPQMGVFTAWFSVTPSIAPTNSVIGLSDGDVGPGSGNTPLHNLHQILIRFGASGAIDARDGATYRADSVIKYEVAQYDFRLVVDVPNKKYAAYVSSKGGPETTIGTNLAYRDSARPATKFDHWAVQANTAKTTVCDFLVRAN